MRGILGFEVKASKKDRADIKRKYPKTSVINIKPKKGKYKYK